MALVGGGGGFGGGLFPLYRLEEILENSSSLKLLVRVSNKFTEAFQALTFYIVVCEIFIRQGKQSTGCDERGMAIGTTGT